MSSSDLQHELATSYLSGGSMAYVDALYEDYLEDPSSVPDDWRVVFNALPIVDGQATDVSHREIRDYFLQSANKKSITMVTTDAKQAQVANLITAYRMSGHLAAKLIRILLAKRLAHSRCPCVT